MTGDDSGLVATNGNAIPPSHPDPLARARVVAVYAVLALIAIPVVLDAVHDRSHLDPGVFATLAFALLALLGLQVLAKGLTK